MTEPRPEINVVTDNQAVEILRKYVSNSNLSSYVHTDEENDWATQAIDYIEEALVEWC